jgi:phenylpropionate dioxygenase-like ring-hydroxylating dioxygenase large terminal subunit
MDKVREYNRVAEALVRYVETNTTDQADDVLTVPSEHYTDPARWQLEMDLIFKRLPLLLALTAELSKPGDYKAMDVIGLPILITRDGEGRTHAFLNVCAHRGAPVADEGRGNRSRFSCRYHGWTYANDGRLMGITDRQKFGELDPCSRGLTALPCDERAGMIFVVLTPGLAIDVPGFLGGMLDDLEQLELQNYHYCGSREIFGANWKVAYDGFLEGYHFATLHPRTINRRSINNVMHYDEFGPHLRIGFAQTHIRKLREVPKEQWWNRENNGYDFVRALFPNVSIFVAPEIGQIAQLLPGPTPGQNRTILNFVSPQPPQDQAETERIEQMIRFLRDVMNDDDYVLGLRIQKGLESSAFPGVVFGRNERGNQIFHRWVEHYATGAPLPEPRTP